MPQIRARVQHDPFPAADAAWRPARTALLVALVNQALSERSPGANARTPKGVDFQQNPPDNATQAAQQNQP
jgi:hypothetical protein